MKLSLSACFGNFGAFVLLGVLIFRERLNRAQLVALLIALGAMLGRGAVLLADYGLPRRQLVQLQRLVGVQRLPCPTMGQRQQGASDMPLVASSLAAPLLQLGGRWFC